MFILQIEHSVPNFEGWKKTFDSDPLHRKQSGVRSHRISRVAANPDYLVIELEFDKLSEAESMHNSLKELWKKVEGKVMTNPQSRVIEAIEDMEY